MYMRRRILLATLCIRGFCQLMVPRENPPFFFKLDRNPTEWYTNGGVSTPHKRDVHCLCGINQRIG